MSTARRAHAWIAAGAGLVAGVALAVAAGAGGDTAAGQGPAASPVRVTAQQLLINQRISQAAVRRANEGRTRLDAAEGRLDASDGRLGALEAAAPRIAMLRPDGSVAGGRGVVAAERTGFGRYRVRFDRSVAGCGLSATIAAPEPGGTVFIDRLPVLGVDAADPAVVTVRVQVVSMPANSEDAGVHVIALC